MDKKKYVHTDSLFFPLEYADLLNKSVCRECGKFFLL